MLARAAMAESAARAVAAEPEAWAQLAVQQPTAALA
jgi:hypothetical protein